jgi:hypothetical protein
MSGPRAPTGYDTSLSAPRLSSKSRIRHPGRRVPLVVFVTTTPERQAMLLDLLTFVPTEDWRLSRPGNSMTRRDC